MSRAGAMKIRSYRFGKIDLDGRRDVVSSSAPRMCERGNPHPFSLSSRPTNRTTSAASAIRSLERKAFSPHEWLLLNSSSRTPVGRNVNRPLHAARFKEGLDLR
jgi:hypothetical protein